MRRTLCILLLVPALAGPAVLTAPASAAHARLRPALRLVSRSPLRLRGSGFRARSRIVVSDGTQRLQIRSSSRGRFSVSFSARDRCSAIRVLATGPGGERAVLRLPAPLCPPA